MLHSQTDLLPALLARAGSAACPSQTHREDTADPTATDKEVGIVAA